MPNHVKNVLKFKKLKTDEVGFLLNTLATEMDTSIIEYLIDFNKIIPEPDTEDECPEACKVNKDSHISPDPDKPWFDWYAWRNVHWGTKWNAYDGYTIIGKSYITFVFNTAWSMPYPVIKQLHLLGFDFELRYADENYGYNCGKMTYSREHGFEEIDPDYIKNPERFAKYLWEKY